MTTPQIPLPDSTGMLAEIQRILGDLSAKIGTLLSDMAYIREDVTEHKGEIRALRGLAAEVTHLKGEVASIKGDFEARMRVLERDKMPKAQITLIFGLITTAIALLVFFGVTVG